MNYFKETQAELRHVAWPTRMQTLVYTVLVVAISIFVALYLGFFDFLFTSTLARFIGVAPAAQTESPIQIETATTTPEFDITPITQ